MIEAIKDFPLYTDGVLIYYKTGDVVPVRSGALMNKLILSGKCELSDPREKVQPTEEKIADVYEKQIDTPIKKKRKKRKS